MEQAETEAKEDEQLGAYLDLTPSIQAPFMRPLLAASPAGLLLSACCVFIVCVLNYTDSEYAVSKYE